MINVADSCGGDFTQAFAICGGEPIFVPNGTYDFPVGLTPPVGCKIIGENLPYTKLRSTHPVESIFNIKYNAFSMEGVQLIAPPGLRVPGGSFIDIHADLVTINNFWVDHAYNAFRIRDTAVQWDIKDGIISNTVPETGVSILVEGGLAAKLSNVFCSNPFNAPPLAHLKVVNCGDLTVDNNCSMIGAHFNLMVKPGPGQTVCSLRMIGSWLDQAATYNMLLDGTAGGTILRSTFSEIWMAQGKIANCAATSGVDGIEFIGCENFGSIYGYSFDGSKNIQITGGKICGNSIGLNLHDAHEIISMGTRIGPSGGWTGNTTGVNISGTTNNYIITGGNHRNNTTQIAGHIPSATRVYANNL